VADAYLILHEVDMFFAMRFASLRSLSSRFPKVRIFEFLASHDFVFDLIDVSAPLSSHSKPRRRQVHSSARKRTGIAQPSHAITLQIAQK
jgi:hypothetical protein